MAVLAQGRGAAAPPPNFWSAPPNSSVFPPNADAFCVFAYPCIDSPPPPPHQILESGTAADVSSNSAPVFCSVVANPIEELNCVVCVERLSVLSVYISSV